MIIGIAGVSRAGKTSLALQIQKWVGGSKCIILSQDDYIQELDQMPKIRNHIDWEQPDSLDFDALYQAIVEAQKNYQIVVVEGHLLFANERIVTILNKKIFIQISKEAFLSRKTLDHRWGNEPDWYIEHIWDQHFITGKIPWNMREVMQVDGEVGYVKRIVKTYLDIDK